MNPLADKRLRICSMPDLPVLDNAWILAQRGPRNSVSVDRPYAHLVEPECAANGRIEDVATIFITNKECPYRCLMCDLWKNTTTRRTPQEAVSRQIAWALADLPFAPHVKLYNAGSFLDNQAIPRTDWPRIAELVADRETVIVESHPNLIDQRCLDFAAMLQPRLEVAMGLETIDPDVLPRLNKQMTLQDFERAVALLVDHQIAVRAFILLRTPFQDEEEGLYWAERSIQYAFDLGIACCAVIPTRAGNGALDRLQQGGQFQPPLAESLEAILDFGLSLGQGRVFVDLWDAQAFFNCPTCRDQRIERLNRMNLEQRILPRVGCDCQGAPSPSPSGRTS